MSSHIYNIRTSVVISIHLDDCYKKYKEKIEIFNCFLNFLSILNLAQLTGEVGGQKGGGRGSNSAGGLLPRGDGDGAYSCGGHCNV